MKMLVIKLEQGKFRRRTEMEAFVEMLDFARIFNFFKKKPFIKKYQQILINLHIVPTLHLANARTRRSLKKNRIYSKQ